MLTVTDGTHTANIALAGNYAASTFVVASDGHGGTLVHDPRAPSPLVFAAAGAAVPAAAGGAAGMVVASPARPTPLLAQPTG